MEPSIESNLQKTETTIKLKHSKLGISSFILCIGAGTICCLSTALPLVNNWVLTGGASDNQGSFLLLGFAATFTLILAAFGLGIAGLFQKNCKKLFAILGTVISGGIILSCFLALGSGLLGLAMTWVVFGNVW
jgi:hypothetical protein